MDITMCRLIARVVISVWVVLVCSLWSQAQSVQTSGSISGEVKDASGFVIPGADVLITNERTGVSRSLVSDSSGFYLAPLLEPGLYRVQVSMPGFKTVIVSDIKVDIQSNQMINVRMEVGEIAEQILVEGGITAQVELRSGEVNKLIEEEQITELPLNGRSFVQLSLLIPGASNAQGNLIRNRQDNLRISFSGSNAVSNMWLVDGANNVNLFTGATLNVIPSVDSIGEFKIQYNNYGPEMGASSGAQINVVTKSGTNEFHGSLYEFHRNSALNSVNFFLNALRGSDGKLPPGVGKQPLVYNNFGYTVGGPVLKDRLFFFWSHEFRMERRGLVRQAVVPTMLERVGDFSGPNSGRYPDPLDPLTGLPFPGNQIPADRLSAAGLAWMKLYPEPTLSLTDPAFRGFNWVSAPSTPIDTRQETLRVDYVLNNSHSFMARYTHDSWTNEVPQSGASWADDPFPVVDSTITFPGYNFSTQWSASLSANTVNQVNFSWSGNSNDLIRGSGEEINEAINNAIPEVFPGPEGHGHATFWGDPYGNTMIHAAPMVTSLDMFIVKDDALLIRGNHTFKFGGLFSVNKSLSDIDASGSAEAPSFIGPTALPGGTGVNPGFGPPGALGNGNIVTGNGVTDLMLRDTYWASFEFSNNVSPDVRWRDYEFYMADTWRVRPRLTLTYGFRWSYLPNAYDSKDMISNFVLELYDPAEGRTSTNGVITPDNVRGLDVNKRSLVKNHYFDIAPRLGFAWDPTGQGKWAIRGGAGVFYNREYLYDVLLLALNPPHQTRVDFVCCRPLDSLPADAEFIGQLGTAAKGKVIEGNTPGSYQWNLTVERELWRNTKVEVAYVANRGHHLGSTYYMNVVPPEDRVKYAIWTFDGDPTTNPHTLRRLFALKGASTEPRVFGRGLDSWYHSLQAYLVKRFSNNLSYQASYTWSKLLATTGGFGHISQHNVSDPSNIAYDKGLVDFDRTHIFSANAIYITPRLDGWNPFLRGVLGNWETGVIYSAQSGRAETIFMTTALTGTFHNRPDLVGDPEGARTINQWFNPQAFAPPSVLGALGTSPRGVFRGPGLNNWDLSVMKNFGGVPWFTQEGARLQFRVELFNALNHTQPQFVNTSFPVTNIQIDLETARLTNFSVPNPNLGRVTGVYEPREIQIGLKIIW